MDQLSSPDLPAYVCYLVVLAFGIVVARSQVNRLLVAFKGCWGFLSTWSLFCAFVCMPLLLFWFLDYSGAIRDTALFAALVVAFGYRQIFIGGVQSIRLPGPTQRLWQPFESWVTHVVECITSAAKRNSDRFEDRLRDYVTRDRKRMQRLMALTFLYTKRRAELQADLAALDAEQVPNGVPDDSFKEMQARKRVGVLLQELRTTVPDYSYFLKAQDVISLGRYLYWFGNVRARIVAYAITLAACAAMALSFYMAYESVSLQTRYWQWRFVKTNNSELDRFRSREYLVHQIEQGRVDPALAPLLVRLRFRDVPNRVADDTLRLVVDSHGPSINRVAIPHLIESLRTENPDVRLRVQRTLLDLYRADYCTPDRSAALSKPRPPPEHPAKLYCSLETSTSDWVPARDDSPGKIDSHVRGWLAWWDRVKKLAETK